MNETQTELLLVSQDLLQTRLMPPRLPASVVRRAALFARLEQGLDQKVTLLTAPTGFGKTTLVSQWLSETHLPAAWLTLDEGDNDPVRFWRYVTGALRRLNDTVGKTTLATLRVTPQPSFPILLTGLINELAPLPGPLLLVLDDLQVLSSPEVLQTLQFLIDHLPPNLRLVLLTRSEPALSVATLRARGDLNELTAGDLRFSAGEIETFLQQVLPFPLSASAFQRLEEKTEGWPAGLRLITLAMTGKGQSGDGDAAASAERVRSAERVIETFNGEHRYVLDYLRVEVFEKQPEPVRDFLLRTSFLDRLCGPLCDGVTGQSGSAGLLEALEGADLFVTRLSGGSGRESRGLTWYRYQPLFAEAIRHEALHSLETTTVLDLYEKAVAWYEQHGLLGEAIHTAIAAFQVEPVAPNAESPRAERAACLVEQYLATQDINELHTLRRWYEQLPEAVFQRHPVLAFHYAQALMFSDERFAPATAAAMEPLLRLAETAWRAEDNRERLGHLLAVRGNSAWWQGDLPQAFEDMRQALAYLDSSQTGTEGTAGRSPLENNLLWRGTVLLGLGYEALLTGSLQEARDHLLEAQALCGAMNNMHGVLAALLILAEVDYQQGEMEPSEANFRQVLEESAIAPATGEEMLDDQSQAWLGLALLAYEDNELDAAEEQAARARELALHRGNEAIWVPASVLLAWVAQARGQTAGGLAQLQALLPRVRQSFLLPQVWSSLARFSMVSGDRVGARRWVSLLSGQTESPFSTVRERQALLAARLAIAEGRPDQALDLLQGRREAAQAQGRLRSEVEILCLEAQAFDALGQPEPAAQALASALSEAQPRGLRRIFLDEGEPLARLLQASANLLRQGLGIYATALLHSFPAGRPARPSGDVDGPLFIEPLSPQEIRVLRLVAAGRSNPEIAEEMIVSINTVKTQVQSIYRKLNVNSREEARLAARELKLV